MPQYFTRRVWRKNPLLNDVESRIAEMGTAVEGQIDGITEPPTGTPGGPGDVPPPDDSGILELKSLHMPATASSVEPGNAGRVASAVNDGNDESWWSPLWGPANGVLEFSAWIYLDLIETTRTGRRAVVRTEDYSFPTEFSIQGSNDTNSWNGIVSHATISEGGPYTFDFTERAFRYWRLLIFARSASSATDGYGVGIKSFEIWGYDNDGYEGDTPDPPDDVPPEDPDDFNAPKGIFTFAAGSPLTTPIPSSVPLVSSGDHGDYMDELQHFLDVNDAGFETQEWSCGLVLNEGSTLLTPDGTVLATGNMHTVDNTGMSEVNSVAVPTHSVIQNAVAGGEGHLGYYSRLTGMWREWIFTVVNPNGDPGLTSFNWGGAAYDLRTQKLLNDSASHPPGDWNRGTTASKLPIGATLILRHEMEYAISRYLAGDLANAYIPHPLAVEIKRHHPYKWVYPVGGTDDTGDGGTLITSVSPGDCPHGTHYQVPIGGGTGGCPDRNGDGLGVWPMGLLHRPSLSINPSTVTYGLPDGSRELMLARIMTRSAQKYGVIPTDKSGASYVILCERPWPGRPTFPSGFGNPTAWFHQMMQSLVDDDAIDFISTGPGLNYSGYTEDGAGGTYYRPPT